MKNVHILPTNKPSRLVKIYNDVNRETFTLKLDAEVNDSFKEYVNIYIISDEETKKGDWVLNPIYKTVYKWIKNSDIYFDRIDAKKIILTTDDQLIKDGVQAIDEEFLKWVVKNPSCDFIRTLKVPYFDESSHSYLLAIPKEEHKQELSLKINDEFLDTTSKEILYALMEEFDNLVTENSSEETLEEAAERLYPGVDRQVDRMLFINGAKWQQERMYNEEEVHTIIESYQNNVENNPNHITYDKWFEQFKKK